MRWRVLGLRRADTVDWVRALCLLAQRGFNYEPAGQPAPGGGWHVDTVRRVVAREQAGPPQPGGAWESACLLVARYEFAAPRIVSAVFRGDDELLGRDMLLEGRFYGLRFLLGVRITAVIDENRDGRQVWGWCYRTLDGHLEQGEMCYEVCKDVATGDVEFVIRGYSRRSPIGNPVVRLGFRLFGRWMQRRFYRACLSRMDRWISAVSAGAPVPEPVPLTGSDRLVLAPSDATAHRPARG